MAKKKKKTVNLIPLEQRILANDREMSMLLGVSEKTLWNLTQPRGPVPCIRLGRSVRYKPFDVITALEKSQKSDPK